MPMIDALYYGTTDTPEGLKRELDDLRREAAAIESRYPRKGTVTNGTGTVAVDPVASFLHEQRARADAQLSDAQLSDATKALEQAHAEYLHAQHRLQSAKTFAIAMEDACGAYMAAMQRIPDDPSA